MHRPTRSPKWKQFAVTACMLAVGACDGKAVLVAGQSQSGEGPGEPASVGASGPDGAALPRDEGELGQGPEASTPCGQPAPARVWRLSHRQYARTVKDLVGVEVPGVAAFEPSTGGSGFSGGSDTAYVSATLVGQYQVAAEQVASAVDLGRLLPCSPADPAEVECVRAFIQQTGRRVLRQPLTAEQEQMYLALYRSGAQLSAEDGVRWVLQALLQSPQFLYRQELGVPVEGTKVAVLNPFEVASQLSFLVWGSAPDDALLDAAERGELDNADARAAQVERLLADPRSDGALWGFVEEYLGLDGLERLEKDAEAFPRFTPTLAAALLQESERFVKHVVREGEGTLSELLTANYSFVNAELAGLYGVAGVSGASFQKVALDPAQRSGLLTQGGWLSTMAHPDSGSPVQRGLLVRRKLLCQDIADPPPNVADTVEAPSESRTTRQRYENHLTNGSCASCHSLIDPIGFGFESYDGLGAFRTTENGVAVDVSGALKATRAIDGTFNGAIELSRRLASADEVSDCVATHFWRYAVGKAETDADACRVQALQRRFRETRGSLLELIRALVRTDSFSRRSIP